MLHKDPFIVSPATFSLIQQLQALPRLSGFNLVAGTALALQPGHRNSIDIDLFTEKEFDDGELLSNLSGKFQIQEIFRRKNTIISLINNVKTNFIRHNYPLLRQPITEEGITFLSLEDIAVMKLHAIIQSGKRLKDFMDIYFLLEHFSLRQMVDFFAEKYPYTSPMIAMKAVNFFGDIDESIDPPKLVKPLKLDKIKQRIQKATLKPSQIF